MIFVCLAISSFSNTSVGRSKHIVIIIRNGFHNRLLVGVRELGIVTAEIRPPDRDSFNLTERVFPRPVDGLKIEPSRCLRCPFRKGSVTGDFADSSVYVPRNKYNINTSETKYRDTHSQIFIIPASKYST